MPRRLLLALLLLVAAPLVLLGWLSESAYRQQQDVAREQLAFLYQQRLDDYNRSVQRVFRQYASEWEAELKRSADPFAVLRRLDRTHPAVRQAMFVDANGTLLYPPAPGEQEVVVEADAELLASMPAIKDSMPDLSESASTDDLTTTDSNDADAVAVTVDPVRGGSWQSWYMDGGLQLIYWIPRTDGSSVGILLNRARWVADLRAALPVSSVPLLKDFPGRRVGFIVLLDDTDRSIHRWGDRGRRKQEPLAKLSLSWPLTSWRFEHHGDHPLPETVSMSLVASLAGTCLLILSLGGYVLTSVQRQMRVARKRVSFASQVSHELRTPLTNIRLYAELAESDLQKLPVGDVRSTVERRLQVIDAESRRLGRLVSGVLEVIRDNRKQQGPRLSATVPDEVIRHCLLQFEPSFAKLDLAVEQDLAAGVTVALDADILEMILVNLLSNVEKYASEGKVVRITSVWQANELVIRLADNGPGIPWRKRSVVFRPFTRLDDSINSPSGTGIGLTIARQLASRHGGELKLVQQSPPATQGACFELRLPASSITTDQQQEANHET